MKKILFLISGLLFVPISIWALDYDLSNSNKMTETIGAYIGKKVSTGDVNNDGYDDMFVNAVSELYVVYGSNAYYSYVYIDGDGDGVAGDTGILAGTDCNDADATVSANQTYYEDADGDGLGNPEVSTSICSSTPPEGYVANSDDLDDTGGDEDNGGDEPPPDIGDEDPNDENVVEQYLSSVTGYANGQIEVTYTDSSVYHYTVFNVTTDKLTIVKQYPDTAYYLVLQPYGKKLALVNVFNGETLTSKKITDKSYKNNSIKIFTIRNKEVVAVTSHKKSKNRLTIFRLKISETKLTKKDSETVKNENIKASKTKKHKKYIHLKNKNSKTLVKYFVTKKFKLKLR
jgi:hypothetical protein